MSASTLAPEAFAARLSSRTSWLAHAHEHLASVASTNDEAARLAAGGAAHGTLITADEQTAGRGRQGHVWFAPAGQNLTFSLVLRPDIAPSAAPAIALAVGLGIAEGLEAQLAPAGKSAAVKWPNDVRVARRKIAGVLTELKADTRRIEHVIVGVGLNVNTRAFPDDLAAPATSLALELGADREPADVLADVLPPLERWIDRFIDEGAAPVVEAFVARGDFLGHPVRIGALHGEALGLDADGALRLRLDSGEERRVLAGDLHDHE
ncbi:MAG: biotin--[acetyl-CoA-carboxylase] ligase [Myxococcales bacterium]|nr:biotin--[acetyl-CoA-carboxylase] ligase [Myxococcales bacterium]